MLKFIDNLSFVFNCFCGKQDDDMPQNKDDKEFMNTMFTSSSQNNVVILPVRSSFELENLYPKHNHVDKWSTFIVGKDKTYIMAQSNDFLTNNLVNHKGTGILPNAVEQFLDPIWDRTLEGNQVQLFMLYDNKTYLLNSYTIKNNIEQIIGAILFMRRVDSLPNTIFHTTSPLAQITKVPNKNDSNNHAVKNKRLSIEHKTYSPIQSIKE
jgi:hypothetical protein